MIDKELSKFEELVKVHEKKQTVEQAAINLGLSKRQVLRLSKRLKVNGPCGLISKKVGAASNNKIPEDVKATVINLVRGSYRDFGPTLAHEYMTERDGVKISVSSVRNIMIHKELWIPKRAKKKRVFKYRERRACEGELQQIDGSPHRWFEERGPECSLIFTLDDATGKIGSARFCPTENTWDYMCLLKDHLQKHGRPIAL